MYPCIFAYDWCRAEFAATIQPQYIDLQQIRRRNYRIRLFSHDSELSLRRLQSLYLCSAFSWKPRSEYIRL